MSTATQHGARGAVPSGRSGGAGRDGAVRRRSTVGVVVLCWLAVLLDGFDLVVLGATVSASLAGILLSALLLALALLRVLLPVRAVGALAVRSRGLDTAVLVVLALGIAALATSPNL